MQQAAAQAAAQAEKAARDATALMIENGVSSANAAALVGGSDSERANGSSSEILSAGGTMSATVNPSTLGAEASYMVVDGGSEVDEDEENDEDDLSGGEGQNEDKTRDTSNAKTPSTTEKWEAANAARAVSGQEPLTMDDWLTTVEEARIAKQREYWAKENERRWAEAMMEPLTFEEWQV